MSNYIVYFNGIQNPIVVPAYNADDAKGRASAVCFQYYGTVRSITSSKRIEQ